MVTRIVILGCGYVGRHVAALEQDAGHDVLGVVRSDASAEALRQHGITAALADLDAPASLAALALSGSVIYYFAPPPPRGLSDPRMHAFVDSLDPAAPPARVVLISTTGVYGNCAGAWIDEETPLNPQADRAHRRADAENTLRQWGREHGVPVVVLRVPGIYGPGRLPDQRLREGRPVLREDQSPYSNRIHVHDLARACLAAARRGGADQVYNVADGQPSTMTDYFNHVADALGLPRPPQISRAEAGAELSAGMMSYLEESKRIDITRMREELGVEPEYTDLARGLAACVVKDSSDLG